MKFVRGLGAFALVALFAGAGFFTRDLLAMAPPDMAALNRLVDPKAAKAPTPTELFQTHFNLIAADYVRPIERDDLRWAAMSGLVDSLGDPHTNFLPPKESESFSTETRGDYVGIGARLSEDPAGARIVTVFQGSPAQVAGVKADDLIIKVDSTDATGMAVDKIVDRIQGKPETRVRLTVVRTGAPDPVEIVITRRRIEIPTVERKTLDGNIAYIRVTNFAQPTTVQFREAVNAVAPNAVGMIIDMRGNPGGLLDTAVNMLGVFVENKTVVEVRTRGGWEQSARSPLGAIMPVPQRIVVLIDGEAASASEIFAGVLRDYKLATLVGEHTYGKMTVQNLLQLPEGASVKVTIGKYYIPSKEDINRKVDEDGTYISGGLHPDIEVELPKDRSVTIGDVTKGDTQLAKAIDVIRGRAAKP